MFESVTESDDGGDMMSRNNMYMKADGGGGNSGIGGKGKVRFSTPSAKKYKPKRLLVSLLVFLLVPLFLFLL